jgi:hypothetical protein
MRELHLGQDFFELETILKDGTNVQRPKCIAEQFLVRRTFFETMEGLLQSDTAKVGLICPNSRIKTYPVNHYSIHATKFKIKGIIFSTEIQKITPVSIIEDINQILDLKKSRFPNQYNVNSGVSYTLINDKNITLLQKTLQGLFDHYL